jgi:hypothetical protein
MLAAVFGKNKYKIFKEKRNRIKAHTFLINRKKTNWVARVYQNRGV